MTNAPPEVAADLQVCHHQPFTNYRAANQGTSAARQRKWGAARGPAGGAAPRNELRGGRAGRRASAESRTPNATLHQPSATHIQRPGTTL